MNDTIYASFIAGGFVGNSIFDLSHESNRDNCFQPYFMLRERLKKYGIEINTTDVFPEKPSILELHMDVQRKAASKIHYLLMLETPQVWPPNGVMSNLDGYRKIFTWNDILVDANRFIKINFPNVIHIQPVDGFENRSHFSCLIAGNKTLVTKDGGNLYPERINAIRWFESNAPQDFDLYGIGWNVPEAHGGLIGKLQGRFWRTVAPLLGLKPFPSYKGRIESKREVLTNTKFAICYENVRDLPGYITEKIFDCFFSGCIPVYWGASNVTDYIPPDCFVDRRQFRDTGEVYRFLKAMTEQEFRGYQQRIIKFLQSDVAYRFSSEYFVETIVNTIVEDLGA